MIEQAQKHLDDGQFSEAEDIYRSLIKEDGSNTEAIYMLAIARQAQGDLDESIGLLEQARTQQPDNANIHYSLATLLMSKRRVDEARKCYLNALQADPTHIQSHNGLAYAELNAGNFVAAENAANLALNEDGRDVQALVYMGTAKLEQGDSTRAIAYLQEAIKESPQHVSAQIQLGRAFLVAKNLAFATQCFQNVVAAQPDSGPAWELLGVAQRSNGDHMEAFSSFKKARDLGRNSPVVSDSLAEYEKAQQAAMAEQAASAPEDGQGQPNPEMILTGAEFEIARGNPDAALHLLANAQMAEPGRVHLLQARALEQKRKHAQALELIEPMAKQSDATDESRLAYVRLLGKSGRQSEADLWIDELLTADSPPLFARLYRGFQLCHKGDEQGVSDLQAIEHEEGLSEVDQRRIHKTLADALDRGGRFDDAADYYSKLSGRLAQVVAVAEGAATQNREWLELKKDIPSSGRVDPMMLPADPVFLFAWPGSGWEWLAAGLGAHSGVMLVADQPETQAKRRELISSPSGRQALEEFTGDSAGAAASSYWSDLRTGNLDPGKNVTFDTMWLSAEMLPTIARIFPSARVLVVNRDPRTMVLDWFRSGYTEIQDMAAIYREQAGRLAQYREMLDLQFIDVSGDDLQGNAVPCLKELCSTLNLPWEDNIGSRLESIAPKVDQNRGSWKDYSSALAGPLQLFK